jgi:hypothetical protein
MEMMAPPSLAALVLADRLGTSTVALFAAKVDEVLEVLQRASSG